MAEIPKGGTKASGSEKSRSNSNIRRNDVSPLPHRLFSFLDARISFFIFTSFATLPTRACKFFFSSSIFSLFTSCHALLPFRLFFLSLFLSSFFFHRVSLLFAQRRFKLAPKPRRFYSRPLLRPLVP